MKLEFPKNFYWGAGTSAHQVEGGNVNDWSEWEKANAERLAKEAPCRWQKWQQEKFPEMFDPQNYISGRACDHYNRYEEDFDIAKQLGHNAHRFSIEWSRIEPEEGKWDEKEIEHYRQVIKALRARNIEPFVTLWHWPNPLWVSKIGGWANKKTISYFVRYAEKIAGELGNDVKFWITINEPEIYSFNSFFRGVWPPGKKNIFSYFLVIENLIKAHKLSFDAIRKINAQAQVGIAKNNTYFEGWPSLFINWWWNFYFLNQLKNHQDFIGINFYFHNKIKGLRFNRNDDRSITDMAWEVYPEGIYHVLKKLKRYRVPIYITESGLADSQDRYREAFIKSHLFWIYKAMKEEADVRGYLHWSLLDNFEWDKGFWPRFGLVEVDYKTMERKIRPSAWEYKKIIENNVIETQN